MNISIVTVGKLKEKYLKLGIEEYTKRLSSYSKIEIIEVPDEKVIKLDIIFSAIVACFLSARNLANIEKLHRGLCDSATLHSSLI